MFALLRSSKKHASRVVGTGEAGFWATEWCPSTHRQTQILGLARQSAVRAAGLVERQRALGVQRDQLLGLVEEQAACLAVQEVRSRLSVFLKWLAVSHLQHPAPRLLRGLK